MCINNYTHTDVITLIKELSTNKLKKNQCKSLRFFYCNYSIQNYYMTRTNYRKHANNGSLVLTLML